MKFAVSQEWIDDFIAHPENEYDVIFQNMKWKFISKLDFAYNDFGKDYYFCEFESVEL